MSKRRNSNNRNTDTAGNEQIKPVESQEEAEELIDSIIDEQDQQENDESVVETGEEIDAQLDDEHVEVDGQEEIEQMSQDTQHDQGFDQQLAPGAENSAGGKGMAGTAMAMSLLALAGTGYNWYDAKSSKTTQSGSSEQVAVDYSAQIQTLEQQIQSLTESQEKLVSVSTTAESAVEQTQAVVDSVTEETGEIKAVEAEAEAEAETETETETEVVEAASAEGSETVAQQSDAGQSTAAEATAVVESASQQVSEASVSETSVSETSVSETMASETDENTTIEGVAATQTDVSATQTVADASIEQGTNAETSTANEQTMAVSASSSDEIKQIARQEVDAVLAGAKKRLGLSEVAQLLSIGEQRLALAGDVTGAQAALGIANERLSAFSDDPLVDPVRDSVAGNIESLSAVEVVDKSALTQDLGNLASTVDTLAFKPLATLAEEPAEEAATAQVASESTEQVAQPSQSDGLSLEGAGSLIKSWGFKLGNTIGDVGADIAGGLKDSVRIKKTGPLSDIVLAPEQEYFIRENMKLMLGGAQRAVLQSNVGVYQQNIGQAQALLDEFFDGDDQDVQSVAGRLSELAQINLEPELPDISNSSASLSEVLKQLTSADSSAN